MLWLAATDSAPALSVATTLMVMLVSPTLAIVATRLLDVPLPRVTGLVKAPSQLRWKASHLRCILKV